MPIALGEPVYFLSLEMRNVGAFGPDGVCIDLSDGKGGFAPWTLILGENGIGKTTALECLLALTPLPSTTSYHGAPRIHALYWPLDGHYARKKHVGNFQPLDIGVTIVLAREPAGSSKPDRVGMTISRDPETGSIDKFSFTTPLEVASDWPGKPVFGYSAKRDADTASPFAIEGLKGQQQADSRFSLDFYAPISVEEWLTELHHGKLARDESDQSSDYDKIRRLLVDALPGVKDIRHNTPKERGGAVRMEYLTDDGWVRYGNLGLGYRSVMGLIGDLAYRLYAAYPDATEPLREAAVVLIDEIDLHLHAKWQRDLIRVLSERFPRVQFIATAHSPLMVQAAAGHNLVLLYRDPETRQVKVDNEVDRIANWRLDQIVTSELFGVPSARPPAYDKDVTRRMEILAKADFDEEDHAEVRRIEAALGDVPLGETEDARRTNDLLRRALEAVEKKAAG